MSRRALMPPRGYQALTPLQKAIIGVIVIQGVKFSPFTEDSMKEYRSATGENEISTSTIQSALDVLRERELVWREARGAYALEDDGVAEWFKHFRSTSVVAQVDTPAP